MSALSSCSGQLRVVRHPVPFAVLDACLEAASQKTNGLSLKSALRNLHPCQTKWDSGRLDSIDFNIFCFISILFKSAALLIITVLIPVLLPLSIKTDTAGQ